MFLYARTIGLWKTTTLRMIAGFEDLDGGEIKVGDKLLSSKKKQFLSPARETQFWYGLSGLCSMATYDGIR